MWIIIKSAGDEYSFTVQNIPGDVGHTYQHAQRLAERVTKAMQATRQGLRSDGWYVPQGCPRCGRVKAHKHVDNLNSATTNASR